MNEKLATTLDKLRTNPKLELFVAGLTLVSVILALLVYFPQIDTKNYMPSIYTFDFVVVIILALDFYARMKASDEEEHFIAYQQ